MASSRRSGRPSGQQPRASSPSPSKPAGTSKPAGSRIGPAASGSRRSPAGSRVGPATSNRTPTGPAANSPKAPSAGPANRPPVAPNAGAAPAAGIVPKARTSGEVNATPKAIVTGDNRPPRAPLAGNALPKASTAPTGAPPRPNTPPPGPSPRLSEQLRALPREEADLPDIPILPPRDDSKVPRNWSAKPPDSGTGRGTTRHVKTGTAILTLESEDAIVIETDDENLVTASDNKIKALSSGTQIPTLPPGKVSGKVPVPGGDAPKSRRTTPALLPTPSAEAHATPPVAQVPVADPGGDKKVARVSAVMKAIQTDPEPPSPARSGPVPVASRKSTKGSRVTKTVEEPAPEPVAVADDKQSKSPRISKVAKAVEEPKPEPVPVADNKKSKSSRISKIAKAVEEPKPEPVPVADNKKSKSSRISKIAKAVEEPKPEPVPVADNKKSKSSRISKVAKAVEENASAAVPAAETKQSKSSRISKAAGAAKPADDHAAEQPPAADEPAPEEAEDDLEADAEEDGEGDEPALGGPRGSSRGSARGSARASARASSRGSARSTGSKRMSKQVDPVAKKKQMMMIGGGAALVLVLIIAFWYITGPMKTAGLIAEIKGPDAGAAKRAVPALADHLQDAAVDAYDKLAGELTAEDRLELLGEGLPKTAKTNSRGTAALAKSWLTSSHIGLRRAAAGALTKFSAEGCAEGLTALLRNKTEDAALRATAAEALGFNKIAAAAQVLGESAFDDKEDGKVSAAAASALTAVRDEAPSSAYLALMKKFPESATRRKIMEGYIVDDAKRSDNDSLDCYKIAFGDPDKELRLLAVKKASSRFETDKVCTMLLPMLKDSESSIAVEVARFLGTVSGAGKKAALEAVLAGIADTGLDAAVRKQLTVSLGYLSTYKDMTALKLLMDLLEKESDEAAQANFRGALTQVCKQGAANDRSSWSTDQWKKWWVKYTAFQAHFEQIKKDFEVAWKKFNENGGMATEEMSHETDRITQAINDMAANECDPEDVRKFENVDTEGMMKHIGQMHKGGSVDFYHKKD